MKSTRQIGIPEPGPAHDDVTTEQCIDATWSIPIARRQCPPVSTDDESAAYEQRSQEFRFGFKVLTGMVPPPQGLSDEEDTKWRLERCHSYFDLMCRHVDRKRPFKCVGNVGYLGFGAAEMLPGDEICVFQGGKVPFVLCRQEEGVFKLVGEPYVDGIMHGEVLADNSIFETINLIQPAPFTTSTTTASPYSVAHTSNLHFIINCQRNLVLTQLTHPWPLSFVVFKDKKEA
jgi:hypothetical protein